MPAYSPEFKEAVITRMLPQRAGGTQEPDHGQYLR